MCQSQISLPTASATALVKTGMRVRVLFLDALRNYDAMHNPLCLTMPSRPLLALRRSHLRYDSIFGVERTEEQGMGTNTAFMDARWARWRRAADQNLCRCRCIAIGPRRVGRSETETEQAAKLTDALE